MASDMPVLSWLHIGDLHLTRAGEPNHRDLERIVALASSLPGGAVDFISFPGTTPTTERARNSSSRGTPWAA